MAGIRIILAGCSLAIAAPVAAQDDMWMNQFHNSLEQQYDYAHVMIGNNAVQKSVERHNRRRMGQPPIPDNAERARATCANGRRMRAHGDENPGLLRLEGLCVQAGL